MRKKASPKQIAYIINWQRENKDKHNASVKKYYQKNKVKLYNHQKSRYLEKKDRLNARKRERWAIDPEFRDKRRKYRQNWKNRSIRAREHLRIKSNNAYYRNREKRLKEQHYMNLNRRIEVIYWYSNGKMCCANCGETLFEFLSIDHINNGGCAERRTFKGNFIKYIIKNGFQDKYQILCYNCNIIKEKNRKVRKNPNAHYHKYRDKAKREMLSLYSNGTMKCECCDFSDERALTFNHIDGGGRKEFKENGSNSIALYKSYKSTKTKREDINVLCSNCNFSLGHYGYCPHSPSP